MRRTRGFVALLCSVLLGLAVLAAVQPVAGRAPDLGTHSGLAAQARPGVLTPLVAKRWV